LPAGVVCLIAGLAARSRKILRGCPAITLAHIGSRPALTARLARVRRHPGGQRSDRIRDTEPDPRKIVAAWGAFSAELAPQVIPIFLLARDAAASDTEVAAVLEQISAARLERMTANARGLLQGGHLRPGITLEQAADILWACSSPELYELLVTRRGWPAERYGQFIAQALAATLLPAERT
jgi:hypothetical protein